ncbi:uncharacterized protein THITE_160883 [Thermothielavioides terrestris NRRL 8126]|uniref:Uncharacterized protein n=1 Tax=Thermothielavioides terrestris (strain ATCC 38088 / NRRL 8126) TaxID=578455 RepID=G2R5J4_THETT|nr:uncharacterized protein THITE_160883 [Thermothielavioides terrestris NRRL 8126]AEO67485.1 hypothetical protein THITE_160883 [Thermothielavioides terrestris NRRL 8126]
MNPYPTPPAPCARFDGIVHIQPSKEAAVLYAEWAANCPSTDTYIHMNLFCDASKSPEQDKGGIAVTFSQWLPGEPVNRPVIRAAWPVTPLYDRRLGEFLALSECLFVATQEILQFSNCPLLAGKTVVVRIFNDNMYNLEYLQGTRVLDQAIMTLARPVLDLIATQSVVIQKCGVSVRLEAHWIPGHEHN